MAQSSTIVFGGVPPQPRAGARPACDRWLGLVWGGFKGAGGVTQMKRTPSDICLPLGYTLSIFDWLALFMYGDYAVPLNEPDSHMLFAFLSISRYLWLAPIFMYGDYALPLNVPDSHILYICSLHTKYGGS